LLKLALTAKGASRLSDLLEGKANVEAALTIRALDDDGNASVSTARVRVRR
jgi:hypothetical protein